MFVKSVFNNFFLPTPLLCFYGITNHNKNLEKKGINYIGCLPNKMLCRRKH